MGMAGDGSSRRKRIRKKRGGIDTHRKAQGTSLRLYLSLVYEGAFFSGLRVSAGAVLSRKDVETVACALFGEIKRF